MTGYSIGEYIRSRRLYLAGLDVISGTEKVIDIAYKYGYDTPESEEEKTTCNCCIGKYGVCIDDIGGGKFRY